MMLITTIIKTIKLKTIKNIYPIYNIYYPFTKDITHSRNLQGMQDLFEDGIDEFITYERDQGKKSRREKKKQKQIRMVADLNDPEKKKQRNQMRRKVIKQRQAQEIQGLTEQEAQEFIKAKKEHKKKLKEKLNEDIKNGLPILIDIVYEKKMNPKENKSLAIQIELIMKAMKHIQNPPAVHLCSVGGYAKTQLQKMRYQYWTLTSSPDDVLDVSKKIGKKPVYLSPDAPQPLNTLDPECCYIIGGLVDRTVIKGASLARARDLQIPAYHLPIREMMVNRNCLNLDHVVKILCKFQQIHDWNIAFQHGAPKRWKKSALKEEQSDHSSQKEEKQEKMEKKPEIKQQKVHDDE